MTDEYAGHARQYRTFIGAVRLICDDLGIHFEDGKIYKPRPNNGSTYRFHAEGEHTLDFLLNTFVKANKIQEARVNISIGYDKGSAPFNENNDITERVNEDGYLERWATQALHNFNLKYHPVRLDALFDKTSIRVYGTYSDPILALKEMKLCMNGMRFAETDKPAYRFRHVNNLMRTYSYCFLVSDGSAAYFWAFFHNMGGQDSGGHSISLKEVEDMVATNLSTKLICVDIEYNKFRKFLSEHVTTFNRVDRNTISFYLSHIPGSFGESFSKSYDKFLKNHSDGEYSQALRSLRALLQKAMEIVCEKKGISAPKNSNVNNLCANLVKREVLDGKTKAWCCAFLSIANLSAHGEFPTEEDLLDKNVKDRVKMTILLGVQLVNELDEVIDYEKY